MGQRDIDDTSATSTWPDLSAVRRTLACARTLLDEVERCIGRSAQDPVTRHGLAAQAVEELTRLSELLTPVRGSDVLQDAE